MKRTSQCAVLAACLALAAAAAAAGPRSKKPPALPRVTSRPAKERDAALAKIEARAKGVTSVKARFVQHRYAPLFDDQDTRTGRLALLKPTFLRVVWDKPHNEEIVFDGKSFWEIKHNLKQIIEWNVVRKKDLLRGRQNLDAGPFKLLAGVKAAELKRDYLIALVDDPRRPKDYLFILVPIRPRDRVEFVRLDVWIDRTLLLPVRIRFIKPNKEVETWTLKELKVNAPVKAAAPKVPRGYKLIKNPA